MEPPKRYSFDEILEQITVFYNDGELEKQFDKEIEQKINRIVEHDRYGGKQATIEYVVEFIKAHEDGLERLVYLLDISVEKFKRIITLIRRLENNFDKEWSMKKIVNEVEKNNAFAQKIADLLINGSENEQLREHLPQYYRERLNLQRMGTQIPLSELKLKMKDKYLASYSALKGSTVESLIRNRLDYIEKEYGISYASGRTDIIDVTADFSIPNLDDPYVIIMSSYQETTSSGQSTKARDMLHCYELIHHRNIQHHENRAFINFVDGGGWLARYNDLKRIVEGCHYALTLKSLGMLENIITAHVPKRYWKKQTTLP